MLRVLLPVLLLLVQAGCDSASTADQDPSPPADLDPTVTPPPPGDWYRPAADVTWQWQLDGTINTSYAVELYDVDLWETPDATIDALHAAGRRVICYFSAGSGDEDRADYDRFLPSDLGRKLDGYPSERWLDIRSANVFQIMLDRLDLAAERGCDGVEPDNVDGYTNRPGFPLTAQDQLAFNRNLANAAHERGLAIALKNSGDQAGELEPYYDFELNEECHEYEECEQLQPFVDAGKPVLNVEYTDTKNQATNLSRTVCPVANAAGLRTLIMSYDLDDAFRVACF
ncbi:MAG: endo alpha-1,4 polygalactosaminidase [Rhodothermales bacterium]